MQVLEYMCHIVNCMLEHRQPSLIIRISASTQEPILVLVILPRDLGFTAAPISHHIVTLVHLQNPMEIHIVATFMT